MELLTQLLHRPTAELVAILTLAHLLADFPLQTNTIAKMKVESLRGLLAHVAIHMATCWALLGFELRFWILVSWLGLAHFMVDYIKVKSGTDRSVLFFVLDQLAHLACIFIISINVATTLGEMQHAISTTILYPSLFVATSFVLMVLGWIWANNLHDEMVNRYISLRWGRERLLELEQRAGFGLICIIGVGVMLIR
ncbi:MAG: DUF3307 domain-containing protein [Caldilineaceae bacterium]